jgi:hypothetical protein
VAVMLLPPMFGYVCGFVPERFRRFPWGESGAAEKSAEKPVLPITTAPDPEPLDKVAVEKGVSDTIVQAVPASHAEKRGCKHEQV